MEIHYRMPGDQDFEEGLFARLGVGASWERLGRAFYNAGCAVDESEDIVLEFEPKDEARVREIVAGARGGDYGPDVRAYWGAAEEYDPDEK